MSLLCICDLLMSSLLDIVSNCQKRISMRKKKEMNRVGSVSFEGINNIIISIQRKKEKRNDGFYE